MEKRTINTLSIKDFKEYEHLVDYVDDDFVVVHSLEDVPFSNDAIKLNCFIVILCLKGSIQMDINNRTFVLQANDLITCLPNMILDHTMISPSYKIKIIGFSTSFLNRVVRIEKGTWDAGIYIYNNPVKHFNDPNGPSYKLYRDLITMKINDTQHPARKDILQCLFAALFCEITTYICKDFNLSEKVQSDVTNGENIFKRFIEKLSKDNGMHRSVAWYANELFYTPKYLSKVVKDVSGRTTLDWINEYAINHIKYQLKHSDKSIKELADDFNFSNISFFGKYVKAHLGVSPANYRNMREE